ncbi:hypothetical protein ACFZBU_12305 [Embleya sp. NPDC008237]|uniref:hypothetical protein n=1 Tax=Embleya sp. NPDC008237 TaxID=3363978 RepID=UPI0036E08D77
MNTREPTRPGGPLRPRSDDHPADRRPTAHGSTDDRSSARGSADGRHRRVHHPDDGRTRVAGEERAAR